MKKKEILINYQEKIKLLNKYDKIYFEQNSSLVSDREYDLLKNNCHRFVWEMVTGERGEMFRFSDLNQNLSRLHDSTVSWHLLDI